MKPSLLAEMTRRLGKGLIETSNQTRTLYAPLVEEWIRSNLRVTTDIAFGSDPRQKLDVYVPADPLLEKPAPVLIFVHQGGFIAGDKADIEAVNVGKFFSTNGFVAVLTNYRLPPAGAWPGAVEDVAAAVNWTAENIAKFSGDPGRIILYGHSSGSTHAATYLLHKEFADKAYPCRGLMLSSGRYRLPPDNADPLLFDNYGRPKITQYYGADREQWRTRQVLNNIVAPKCPVFLLLGELDNLMFESNTAALINEVVEKSRRMPRFLQVAGHNHVSYFFHLGTGDDPAGPHLLQFANLAITQPLDTEPYSPDLRWYQT